MINRLNKINCYVSGQEADHERRRQFCRSGRKAQVKEGAVRTLACPQFLGQDVCSAFENMWNLLVRKISY